MTILAESIPRLLVTTREAARILSVSEKTLWNRTEPRGPIPCIRLSPGTIRYSVSALQRFIEAQGK